MEAPNKSLLRGRSDSSPMILVSDSSSAPSREIAAAYALSLLPLDPSTNKPFWQNPEVKIGNHLLKRDQDVVKLIASLNDDNVTLTEEEQMKVSTFSGRPANSGGRAQRGGGGRGSHLTESTFGSKTAGEADSDSDDNAISGIENVSISDSSAMDLAVTSVKKYVRAKRAPKKGTHERSECEG